MYSKLIGRAVLSKYESSRNREANGDIHVAERGKNAKFVFSCLNSIIM